MGLSRRKAPFPMRGGVVLSSGPGLSGPSWSQAWPAGVQLTLSPGTQEGEGRGAAHPIFCPDPPLRN